MSVRIFVIKISGVLYWRGTPFLFGTVGEILS